MDTVSLLPLLPVTYLFSLAQPHTGPNASRDQGYFQPVRGIRVGARYQQQSHGTGRLEAQDELLRLRAAALGAAHPHGHVLSAVKGQRCRF